MPCMVPINLTRQIPQTSSPASHVQVATACQCLMSTLKTVVSDMQFVGGGCCFQSVCLGL